MNNIEDQMLPSEGIQLCIHCGLCCIGYFHTSALIQNDDDLILAHEMGATVSVEQNGEQFFALACPKFDGKCSVYPIRPSVCEAHQCDLLKSVKAGEMGLDKAKKVSDEMKTLCITLDQALNTLVPGDHTQNISARFKPLFTSENTAKIQKNHTYIFLKYAAYRVLKNRYFYQEDNNILTENL